MQKPEPLNEEQKELLHKYCRVNSRMDWQDAEDVLREKGADYIKSRIAKLEKRHTKPKVKPDLSILIKGIATAYDLNVGGGE
ncbi:MAG TPA: hypothetical protein VMW91_02230 [Desulfosporosinus sp.]|nr:hypothetical protein [Desulfosporosinus sp.]